MRCTMCRGGAFTKYAAPGMHATMAAGIQAMTAAGMQAMMAAERHQGCSTDGSSRDAAGMQQRCTRATVTTVGTQQGCSTEPA